MSDSSKHNPGGLEIARRYLPVIALFAAVSVVVLLAWYVIDVFFLAFAGILLAITLRAPATWLATRTRLSEGWALAVVIAAILVALGITGWFFGHSLAGQFATLARRVPEAVEKLRGYMAQFDWLISPDAGREWLKNAGSMVGRGLTVVAATFGVAANFVIVLFCGIFFAIQPALYLHGFLRLVPPARRQRLNEVIDASGHLLRRWVLGQLLLMLIIFVMTFVGLWLLGVPLPFALALIAGLLEFIPYLGPILSAVPAVLVALSDSPALAGYVILLYVGLQSVEGYVLQPLIQQRAVDLPPATVLLSQVILGILVGAVGIMLATPVAATMMVAIQMLYIEDVLGERNKTTAAQIPRGKSSR
ncbi:MAG: hypothetical protein JWN94_2738 [Betaproteobacteria bacterium]|nr:hypothetical protein [Betaproteobacteria bacterium]